MEPRIVSKQEMKFIGIEGEQSRFEDIWFKEFIPRQDEIKNRSMNNGYFALLRQPQNGISTYMVSFQIPIEDNSQIPNGFTMKTVPPMRYVEFDTTPRQLGNKTQAIVDDWFSKNPNFRYNNEEYDFEWYPPTECGVDSSIQVWIPLKD